MAHAELPSPVVEDPGADPRKYATYLATRPRKWERVRASKRKNIPVASPAVARLVLVDAVAARG